MIWCDTSALDWEAVGAVGTWIVGAAAVVLAWRTGAIAARLKKDQAEREDVVGRAVLSGLRLETVEYVKRLAGLRTNLVRLKENPGQNPCGQAETAFALMANVGFSDFDHRRQVLPSFPEAVVQAVNWLYAKERICRANFRSHEEVFAKFSEEPSLSRLDVERFVGVFDLAIADLNEVIEQVSDALDVLSVHAGMPAKE